MNSALHVFHVNDLHSALNASTVAEVLTPASMEDIIAAIGSAQRRALPIAVCAGRHAMGGQQFANAAVLLDMSGMNRIIAFNDKAGLIEVEAGIMWPALIDYLEAATASGARWSIRQKQTGADRLSLGGCLSSNIHGRGLQMKPFIDDVEAFTLIDGAGRLVKCSRRRNAQLFALAIGGYGLFGVIAAVTLRLAPRRKLRRDVSLICVANLTAAFAERIMQKYAYGDFQFAIDPDSTDFLSRGVLSCYLPVDEETPMNADDRQLSEQDWRALMMLAHTDKQRAFERYAAHYLATSGQVCWSDRLQQSTYPDCYHEQIDARLGHCGSEVIGEIYVPPHRLVDFMAAVAADFRAHAVNLVYGTIRLIERDRESFLPWAKQDYACVIFNLHTPHTSTGIEATAQAFRRLIDLATARDGSFYLTYSKAASASQVRTCYPNFEKFLELKRHFDPGGRFESNWYRHYSEQFAVLPTQNAA